MNRDWLPWIGDSRIVTTVSSDSYQLAYEKKGTPKHALDSF